MDEVRARVDEMKAKMESIRDKHFEFEFDQDMVRAKIEASRAAMDMVRDQVKMATDMAFKFETRMPVLAQIKPVPPQPPQPRRPVQ